MLNSVPVSIGISIILGFLAGLGIGGGSLLILWLTLVLGMDGNSARQINLLFFLPCAISAICFRWKQGYISLSRILPGILAGCCASALLSWYREYMHLEIIKKLFGGLLILTGIRELFYKPQKANE